VLSDRYTPRIDLLFVCTGNICRSPLAAGLLRVRLEEVAPGAGFVVDSAGIAATGGPVPAEVEEVARGLGVDLAAHRGRHLDPAEVAEASLVVGMTREHVREVSLSAPGSFPRTYTLREIVRRAGERGGRRPDESIDSWVARLGEGRRAADLLGTSPEDDVADPFGGPRRGYVEMGATLDGLLSALAPAVAGRPW